MDKKAIVTKALNEFGINENIIDFFVLMVYNLVILMRSLWME